MTKTRKSNLKPGAKITVRHAIQAMIRAGIADPSQYLGAADPGNDIPNARLSRRDVKKMKRLLIKDGQAGIQYQGIEAGQTLRLRIFPIHEAIPAQLRKKSDPAMSKGVRSNWVSPFSRPEVIAKSVATRKRNKALRAAGLAA